MKKNEATVPIKQNLQFRTWCKPDHCFRRRDAFEIALIGNGEMAYNHGNGYISFGDATEKYFHYIQLSTNKTDKNNRTIFAGDIIKLHNKSEHTKKEYWNPIYELTWDGFEFGLKYLGGGKSPDSPMFKLRHYSSSFEIIGNIFESTIILPKK